MKSCSIRNLSFMYRTPKDRYILERVAGHDAYGITDRPYVSTVIDIGAHVGSFTVLAAAGGARVIAFEPEGSNFDLLQRNVAANRLPNGRPLNVAAVCCAISDRAGFHRLSLNEVNTGAHSIMYGTGSLFQEVVAVRLEDVLDHFRIQTCDFLKMDCEGAEAEILPTVLRIPERFPRLAIEFHGGNGRDLREMLDDRYDGAEIPESNGTEWTFSLRQ